MSGFGEIIRAIKGIGSARVLVQNCLVLRDKTAHDKTRYTQGKTRTYKATQVRTRQVVYVLVCVLVYPHRAEAQRSPWSYESPINGHAYCDHCLSAGPAFEPTKATRRRARLLAPDPPSNRYS